MRLNKALIKRISREKQEPEWMLERRLKAFQVFQAQPLPKWGADLSGLDFDQINYFVKPRTTLKRSWSELSRKTRNTFEKLGIPEQERRVLAGVGAQWDSALVYQSLRQELNRQGVIFCEMDEAVKKYPRLVKQYFMTQAVTIANNKFSALNGAVWSGGVFLYLPKRVKLKRPLEGYFWLNLAKGGQFEHTLIIAEAGSSLEYIEGCSAPTYHQGSLHSGVVEIFVGKKAKVKFLTIQNWSQDVYNLGTKRAIVAAGGLMDWISVSLGSQTTMVYPTSVLAARGAKTEHLSLSLAGKGQELDTGGKALHLAPETSSNIVAKSIAQAGGQANYRGLVKIIKGARGAKSSVNCESLLLDARSQAKTYPAMEVLETEAMAVHEAKTGKIAEEELFYLQSRGLSEKEAMGLLVNGFVEPVVSQLPLEYAVEINRLIDLEF